MDLMLKNQIVEELSEISGIDSKYIRNLDEEELTGFNTSLGFFYDDEIKEDIVTAVSISLRKTELPKLSEKLMKEYDNYLDELRKGSIDNAISNAYQISVKEEITNLSEIGYIDMLPDQYSALLSSENALDEIYLEVRNSDDIAIKDCFATAADRIKISLERKAQESKTGFLDLTKSSGCRK